MRGLISFIFASTAFAVVLRRDNPEWENQECGGKIKRVAVFSFDGMHSSDLDKYLARGPSNFTTLINTGYKYTNAYTTDPSDSFPGTMAAFTGAFPRTTGVWYDDTYDRTYFAPNSGCKGVPGAEGTYMDVECRKVQ
jgi:predicted AlkP superfamily pyrophosphatase or phosphodiesterase